MPDYMCELPLWGRSWESLKLPVPLLNRLADWQDYFDGNFDPISGWTSPDSKRDWETQSVDLISELRNALNGVQLIVDLWPLEKTE